VVERWKAAYLEMGEQAFSHRRCLAELERVCGRLAMENEL